MSYEIINNKYHTGLLVPAVRTNFAVPYRTLTQTFDRKQIIERLKLKWRARSLFGDNWILNQGRRGSCNGYSNAGSLARVNYLSRGKVQLLSGEFVYSNINGGVDSGSGLAEGMEFITGKGACPLDMVRHEEYLLRNISPEAFAAAMEFVAHECYSVDEEIELADGLSKGFIAVVAVHASNRYSSLDQNGIGGESNGVGNHSVTVDDCIWDGNQFLFDQPNSWGLNWGQRGRSYLTWQRHLRTTVRYHQFFLIRGVTDKRNSLVVS